MLNIGINIFFLLAIVICAFRHYRISVLLYVIGMFVSPVIHIGTLYLSFDIWCFPVLFLIVLLKWNRCLRVKIDCFSLLPYFLIYIVIMAVNAIVYQAGISLPTVYAILRFILTIAIIKNAWQDELFFWVDKALFAILLVNLSCCVLQLTNLVPVDVFYNFYYKPSMTPLMTQLQAGRFDRAYGATGTPVYLGAIAALSYAFYIPACVGEDTKGIKLRYGKLMIAAACGMMALSKTAILSIPLITIFSMIVYLCNEKKRGLKSLLRFGAFLLGGICVLVLIAVWLESKGYFILYYLEFLKDPLKAFETRYNSETGILSGAMKIIKANLLFGVGNRVFPDVFVGDSVYVVLLYETGILGLLAYMFPYIFAFVRSIREKQLSQSAILFAFALVATGGSFYLSYFWVLFSAFIFGSLSKTENTGYSSERILQNLIL